MVNGTLSWSGHVVKDRGKYYYNHEFPKGHVHEITVRSLGFGFETNSRVLPTLATTATVALYVGAAATAIDVYNTFQNGHCEVAFAKLGIAAFEGIISAFVPGEAYIAMAIAAIETLYGNQLYEYIDNSYKSK